MIRGSVPVPDLTLLLVLCRVVDAYDMSNVAAAVPVLLRQSSLQHSHIHSCQTLPLQDGSPPERAKSSVHYLYGASTRARRELENRGIVLLHHRVADALAVLVEGARDALREGLLR